MTYFTAIVMNRLIIIGNGFDLAHGLKTSYCDFISNYLVEVLNEFYQNQEYVDELIQIKASRINGGRYYPTDLRSESEKVYSDIQNLQDGEHFDVDFKCALLQKTIKSAREIRWVDLEYAYFDELLDCRDKQTKEFDFAKVSLLNNQFAYLKQRFETYMSHVQFDPKGYERDPDIFKIFKGLLKKDDFPLDKSVPDRASRTMFLNFNYTNTVSKYLGSSSAGTSALGTTAISYTDTVNHIHGELGNKENPIIFGFGDEYDSNYLQFENLRNNEVFRHIKSFAYLKTRKYHELIRFLNLDKFQVLIAGHSCGLSDRTMFREIFEHDNCRSIKVFYFQRADGSNDFDEKTYDISRHFTNHGMMRKKIVSEPNCSPLPQYDPKYIKRKTSNPILS